MKHSEIWDRAREMFDDREDKEIVGVCGRCGQALRAVRIFDTTFHREYAKCEACGCFHGQLRMNAAHNGGEPFAIEDGQYWNPVF